MQIFRLFILSAALITLVGGCGGQIAKTGGARVTDVSPQGFFTLQYADGKAEVKRISPDNMPKDCRIALKNMLAPARYVETARDSTLTLPQGDTITYQNVKSD